jgi:MFS family permease
MATVTVAGERRAGGRTALTVVSFATMLALMNYNATFATLPAMARDLSAGAAGQTWILSGISLGTAVPLLVAGSVADDHGRRRVFAAGAALLAVSSVVCAAAPSTTVFVVGRLIQGAATAALLAAGLGLLGRVFPAGPSRVRATGVWGAMLGLGIALGPEVSAGLAGAGSWRTWYLVAAVASAALWAAARGTLRESRAERPRPLDLPGVTTFGVGLAALLGAITVGPGGWTRPEVLGLFAVAVVLLLAFVQVEARARAPMLDLALFRRADFTVATAGAFFTGVAVIGMMSYLPTVVNRALGQPPLAAGAVITLWAGVSFVVALQVRRLPVHGRHLIAAGLVLCAIGELTLLGLAADWGWWRLAPSLAVSGIGSGLLNAALARLAVESVPPSRAAMGSGANNTARYVGASVGVAMVAALSTSAPGLVQGAHAALVVCACVALAGAVFAASVRVK